MAEYMVLIWDDEAAWENADQHVVDKTMREHEDFMARHVGALRGGDRLHPSSTATSIRHTTSGVLITDGVFAETKEHVGGFYLFEATDLDEALAIAKQVPCPFGWVELRPIFPTS